MTAMRLFLVVFLGIVCPLAVQAEAYIAPEPPDSVLLAGPQDGIYRVFLSRRTPAEVQAFYAKVGAFTNSTNASYQRQSPVVLSYQQVVDILIARHGDLTLADDLVITIKWKPLPSSHDSCTGDFLRDLNVIARTQKREAEFEALCQQYGYLDTAFFQRVPDARRPGQWTDADKEILARAHTQLGGKQAKALAGNAAETAQRLQQLAMSGHTAEAQALAEQFKQQAMQASGSALDWDGWVKVLKEADSMAYRTWIMLPTHPNSW